MRPQTCLQKQFELQRPFCRVTDIRERVCIRAGFKDPKLGTQMPVYDEHHLFQAAESVLPRGQDVIYFREEVNVNTILVGPM